MRLRTAFFISLLTTSLPLAVGARAATDHASGRGNSPTWIFSRSVADIGQRLELGTGCKWKGDDKGGTCTKRYGAKASLLVVVLPASRDRKDLSIELAVPLDTRCGDSQVNLAAYRRYAGAVSMALLPQWKGGPTWLKASLGQVKSYKAQDFEAKTSGVLVSVTSSNFADLSCDVASVGFEVPD